MLIVFGMPTVGKVKNVIYNSSIIVSPDDEIYSYDKLYLPTHSVFEEKKDIFAQETKSRPLM